MRARLCVRAAFHSVCLTTKQGAHSFAEIKNIVVSLSHV